MNCKKRKHEHGGTTLEALMAVVILFLIVFAMIQIYQWCITKQFCQYSAFYTSKSLSLGYQDDVALRSARVAAISISGKSVGSGNDDENAAENYMIYGDGSGVSYDYWHPRGGKSPTLSVYSSSPLSTIDNETMCWGRIKFHNAPLIDPAMAKMFSINNPPEPSATVYTHNYAKELLVEND